MNDKSLSSCGPRREQSPDATLRRKIFLSNRVSEIYSFYSINLTKVFKCSIVYNSVNFRDFSVFCFAMRCHGVACRAAAAVA